MGFRNLPIWLKGWIIGTGISVVSLFASFIPVVNIVVLPLAMVLSFVLLPFIAFMDPASLYSNYIPLPITFGDLVSIIPMFLIGAAIGLLIKFLRNRIK